MTERRDLSVVIRKGEIPQAGSALAQLASVPVRAPTAVHILRLARAVAEVSATVQAERDRLVATHAARDDQGRMLPATDPAMRERGMIRIDPDRSSEFEASLVSLLEETVELPGTPLDGDELRREDGRPVDIPAAVLLDLGPLFRDGGQDTG